ncbi:S8 family serine peptidase [Pedobacter nyackensis]|uniref:Subtilase family protein n=1 Tax=Pedobacter nyackensis TaxID=475255 RepID=A0A1W2AP16_9SPHI|nr:S8 family serine peptidase [Pedobacter nyackensis]SMC62413.1 Subtilase family protein [Pedobacter nyackensis]
MRRTIRYFLTAVLSVFVTFCTLAQNNNGPSVSLKGWYLLDWKQDHVYGISLQQAYDFLKARHLKPNSTILGVIDSGVDTTHEDLKNVLWTNRSEIAGNGKDDDGNGYVDDVHGWNFLGNKDGKNVGKESLEEERVYQAYKSKWENIDSAGISRLSRDELYDYNMWQRAAKMARRFASKSQATTKDSEMYNSKPKNHRDEVVGDNYNDINDSNYGNGDVTATDPMHGTHVAGIIGAQQNNNPGVNGVADNVQIMVLRAVPDGDEYDKDIALAIRYAVDNGARVINMSFGKFYSPGKKWVDDAVKYAQKKDVLLVHAAGNDSKNIDKEFNYPSPVSKDSLFTASNWITVGASGMSGSGIAAPFSNYGKQNVDVFAPGVRIYSTLPKANKYVMCL